MKFVLIFGPPAVGKMSVGRALAERTDLKLFHNHMSIELARNFFDFGTPGFTRLDKLFRFEIFKEVAESDLLGLIFTFVWAFDLESEKKYVDSFINIFVEQGAEIYYVELEAPLEERLIRNRHEDRLHHKPSKRDVVQSEEVLLMHEREHRFNTHEGEFTRENYLRIDNEGISADDAARLIQERFDL